MGAEVIISGIGIVSPLGLNYADHMSALKSGNHAFSRIEQYDTAEANTCYAGEIKDIPASALPTAKLRKMLNRKDLMGLCAAYQAVLDAGINAEQGDPFRRGAFIGSCSTQIGDFMPYVPAAMTAISADRKRFDSSAFGRDSLHDVNPLASVKVLLNGCLAHVCQQFSLQGPNANIMDGGISGLTAIDLASKNIRNGLVDWALVGAISAPLDPFQMSVAYRSKSIADQSGVKECDLGNIVKPFDKNSAGTILSEGAVFFVLEASEHYISRVGSKTFYGRISNSKVSGITDQCLYMSCADGSAITDAKELEFLQKNKVGAGPRVVTLASQHGCFTDASVLFCLAHGLALIDKIKSTATLDRVVVSAENTFGQRRSLAVMRD